jgi:hypothetical protein
LQDIEAGRRRFDQSRVARAACTDLALQLAVFDEKVNALVGLGDGGGVLRKRRMNGCED